MRRLRCLSEAWGAAVRFLTVLPWGRWAADATPDLGAAAVLFPLVGLLLGAVMAAVRAAALALGSTPCLAAALSLTGGIALTGGLHLDGLMDAADGLLGSHPPKRRLEIMHDARAGAFGVVAVITLLLLKLTALQTAPWQAVVFAPAMGRWGAALAMAAFPYARSGGLGRMWYDAVGFKQALLVTGLVAALLAAAGWWPAWGLWAWATLLGWAGARWALRRIPGLTGDVYGALIESLETIILTTAALLL